jgi:hypothetical protein
LRSKPFGCCSEVLYKPKEINYQLVGKNASQMDKRGHFIVKSYFSGKYLLHKSHGYTEDRYAEVSLHSRYTGDNVNMLKAHYAKTAINFVSC